MTLDTDRLSDTFAAHEHMAPDADTVLARAREIARVYQRRRWAVRATGGAALGAGIVAGSLVLPGVSSGGSTTVVMPAAGGGNGSAQPSPTPVTVTNALNAYFAAGYDYQDALKLKKLWHSSGDIEQVKAEAGAKLLEGQQLPIKPSGPWEATPPSAPSVPTVSGKDIYAFFAAGYTYDDAVKLGRLWHESPYKAKSDAGKKLAAGQTLPVAPSGKPASSSENAMHAFFAAGYTYDDAVKLSRLWHDPNLTHVKVEAGKRLLGGHKLPIAP